MTKGEGGRPGCYQGPELGLSSHKEAGRLGDRADHDLVDVYVWRPGDGEHDAVSDVLGHQRLHTLVDSLGRLAVAAKANQAELRLHHPRSDLGNADGLAIELEPKCARDGAHRVLAGRVAGASLVDLESGDRAQVHDVPVLCFAQE